MLFCIDINRRTDLRAFHIVIAWHSTISIWLCVSEICIGNYVPNCVKLQGWMTKKDKVSLSIQFFHLIILCAWESELIYKHLKFLCFCHAHCPYVPYESKHACSLWMNYEDDSGLYINRFCSKNQHLSSSSGSFVSSKRPKKPPKYTTKIDHFSQVNKSMKRISWDGGL